MQTAHNVKNRSVEAQGETKGFAGEHAVKEVHAVILAGGSGSRLWPLSRQQLPKQFLALDGAETLLQTTINRLAPTICTENVLIVTQEAHAKGEAYHALLPYS